MQRYSIKVEKLKRMFLVLVSKTFFIFSSIEKNHPYNAQTHYMQYIFVFTFEILCGRLKGHICKISRTAVEESRLLRMTIYYEWREYSEMGVGEFGLAMEKFWSRRLLGE